MIISVQEGARRAMIESPSAFSIEALPVTIMGITANAATLRLVLYAIDGVKIAECLTWTGDSVSGFTGTLDSRSDKADTYFSGQGPSKRLPGVISIADANRLWCVQDVEIVNNPERGAPSVIIPSKTYLTADLFADVADLPADPTPDDVIAAVNAILERAKA